MDILAPRKEELLKAYEPDRTHPNQWRGWEGGAMEKNRNGYGYAETKYGETFAVLRSMFKR